MAPCLPIRTPPPRPLFILPRFFPRAIGAAFPGINPALYSDITFSADIQPYLTPANVTARFAVQMNGGSWFVSTNTLPVPATVGAFCHLFKRIQSRRFAMGFPDRQRQGTGSGATIGPGASGNLTGNITGAGLVFTHTGNWRDV